MNDDILNNLYKICNYLPKKEKENEMELEKESKNEQLENIIIKIYYKLINNKIIKLIKDYEESNNFERLTINFPLFFKKPLICEKKFINEKRKKQKKLKLITILI